MNDQEYNQLWIDLMGVIVNALGDFSIDGKEYRVNAVTDMTQCWMLVEKFEGEGYGYASHSDDGKYYHFLFMKAGKSYPGEGETLMKAVINAGDAVACAKAKGLRG